jgi:hypothetical protein
MKSFYNRYTNFYTIIDKQSKILDIKLLSKILNKEHFIEPKLNYDWRNLTKVYIDISIKLINNNEVLKYKNLNNNLVRNTKLLVNPSIKFPNSIEDHMKCYIFLNNKLFHRKD